MTKPKTKPTWSFRKYLSEADRLYREQFAKKIGVSLDYFEKMLRGVRPWGKYEEACREVLRAAAQANPDEIRWDPDDFSFDPDLKEHVVRSGSGGEPVRTNDEDSYIDVYLKRKGWSERKLAEATDINRGTIQRVLQGRPIHHMLDPDFSIMIYIANAMGVKLSDIPWMEESQQRLARVNDEAVARVEKKHPGITVEEAFKHIDKHMGAARKDGAAV